MITFIATGGTIDKDYPHTTKGWAFEFGEPAITRMLAKLNLPYSPEVLVPFQKDSLEIGEADREALASTIKSSQFAKVIVTHGTDTLIETAQFLARQNLTGSILLTGAMRPERFENSDAELNLGAAIGAVLSRESGIYLAINGIVKSYDEMTRDLKTGQFL